MSYSSNSYSSNNNREDHENYGDEFGDQLTTNYDQTSQTPILFSTPYNPHADLPDSPAHTDPNFRRTYFPSPDFNDQIEYTLAAETYLQDLQSQQDRTSNLSDATYNDGTFVTDLATTPGGYNVQLDPTSPVTSGFEEEACGANNPAQSDPGGSSGPELVAMGLYHDPPRDHGCQYYPPRLSEEFLLPEPASVIPRSLPEPDQSMYGLTPLVPSINAVVDWNTGDSGGYEQNAVGIEYELNGYWCTYGNCGSAWIDLNTAEGQLHHQIYHCGTTTLDQYQVSRR